MKLDSKKVEKVLEEIGASMEKDVFSSREYLVLCGNLLISFGRSNIQSLGKYPELNFNDANQIELTLAQYPDDVNLASILQGHAVVYSSQNLGEDE